MGSGRRSPFVPTGLSARRHQPVQAMKTAIPTTEASTDHGKTATPSRGAVIPGNQPEDTALVAAL